MSFGLIYTSMQRFCGRGTGQYLVLIDYFDLSIYLKMYEKGSAMIELLEQIFPIYISIFLDL